MKELNKLITIVRKTRANESKTKGGKKNNFHVLPY